MNQNLYQRFAGQFTPVMKKVVLTTETDERYTYHMLHTRSAQYAGYLFRCGIQPGDRVMVQVEKSAENLFCYLGCLRVGAVYVPLNTAYHPNEVAYFIRDAAPSLLICDPARAAEMRVLGTEHGDIPVETLDRQGRGSLYTHSLSEDGDWADVPRAVDDTAVILYTSGTTGKPKGAMLTHGNLATNGATLQQCWAFSADDVLLHMLPLFHVHGLFFACHCVLLSAASMIFLPKFTVDYTLQYLPAATVMMGVPTYYTRLLDDSCFTRLCGDHIRLFISGSAPLQPQTFTAFADRTGQCILERYGMTETGINTANPLQGIRKPGTVGLPLPGVTVRIADAEDRPLAQGEIGQIQIRGSNVFAGYWNNPAKTAQDFTAEGFFRTGDIGSVDEDGYLTISGRAKDLIITGGLNVYPKEIELCLDSLDGVVESAVIGLPHHDFGEAVTAVVCTQPDCHINEAEIIEILRGQFAHFKVPKKILFITALPKNTMGKVQKNLLRDQFYDLYQTSNLLV